VALIDLDHDDWLVHGDRDSFTFTHSMTGDPRLTLPSIAKLAGRLPSESVDMNYIDLDPAFPGQGTPPLDVPATQMVLEIEGMQRWMTAKNLEQDPEYLDLINEALDSVDRGLQLGKAMIGREGYIFVSAPTSTTPAHVDHEHNLLLQIQGTKRVTVGGFPSVEAEQALLEFLNTGGYGRTGYLPSNPVTFELEPGTGMYIPPRCVHMVENGPELCISLSLVFHTVGLLRAARVYQVNAKMRRFGVHPRPYGRSLNVDKTKSAVMLVWQRMHANSKA
jgi:Cupin superfamily protein